MQTARKQWQQLVLVLEEVFTGRQREATFLDDGDAALLDMLAGLTAAEASREVGGENIVAHARHVLFSLTAYFKAIEQNAPSHIAENWPAWDSSAASPAEWKSIIEDLGLRLNALLALLDTRQNSPERAYLLALGALAHMAFHLGAIQVKYELLKNGKPAVA